MYFGWHEESGLTALALVVTVCTAVGMAGGYFENNLQVIRVSLTITMMVTMCVSQRASGGSQTHPELGIRARSPGKNARMVIKEHCPALR
jgi:hypothetical protein